MPDDRDTTADRGEDESAAPIEDDPTDSVDLEHADAVRVGVTRGETDLEIGPPRDYPDRADVSVRPEAEDGHRVVLSIDAMAGDHGTGHADVELTPAEARVLRDQLDETVRWMTGTETKMETRTGTTTGNETEPDRDDSSARDEDDNSNNSTSNSNGNSTSNSNDNATTGPKND